MKPRHNRWRFSAPSYSLGLDLHTAHQHELMAADHRLQREELAVVLGWTLDRIDRVMRQLCMLGFIHPGSLISRKLERDEIRRKKKLFDLARAKRLAKKRLAKKGAAR